MCVFYFGFSIKLAKIQLYKEFLRVYFEKVINIIHFLQF